MSSKWIKWFFFPFFLEMVNLREHNQICVLLLTFLAVGIWAALSFLLKEILFFTFAGSNLSRRRWFAVFMWSCGSQGIREVWRAGVCTCTCLLAFAFSLVGLLKHLSFFPLFLCPQYLKKFYPEKITFRYFWLEHYFFQWLNALLISEDIWL